MKLTSRAAAETISVAHNIGLRDAARVLTAGLAGPATKQGSALLYDEQGLDRLLDRPECSVAELDRWRPLVVRVGRNQAFDIAAPWSVRAHGVAGPWRLPLPTSVYMALCSSLNPPAGMRHPFIAVVAGWVAVGAEITGYDEGRFRLEPPGPWFDSIRDTWLPLPRRRRWILWGAPSDHGRPGDGPGAWIKADESKIQPPGHPDRTASQAAYRASLRLPTSDVPVRSNGRL